MNTKDEMFSAGLQLAIDFSKLNGVAMPSVVQLQKDEPLYGLATCAFYRYNVIRIMVGKCAHKGYGGRAWSWPGYTIDRTPFGVIQHELGHHFDHVKTFSDKSFHTHDEMMDALFSKKVYDLSKEPPMSGYLGKYGPEMPKDLAFYMEWFAENFRVFVTNPGLSLALRPRFYAAMQQHGIQPLPLGDWKWRLIELRATDRIISQAEKKIALVSQ